MSMNEHLALASSHKYEWKIYVCAYFSSKGTIIYLKKEKNIYHFH